MGTNSIEETKKLNQQSAKNAAQLGNANSMEAGSDMMTKQQNELDAVKKANQQSSQNKK